MKNKNKYFKIISSTLIAGAFLFLAFGSGESDPKKDAEERMENVSINSTSASFVYERASLEAQNLATCGIAQKIWTIVHENSSITNIDFVIKEECEDSYGKKNKFETKIHLDKNWLNQWEASKYETADAFCNKMSELDIFSSEWQACYLSHQYTP